MDNPREQRGLEIAAKARLQRDGDRWFVPSQSRGGTNHGGQYIVKPDVSNPLGNIIAKQIDVDRPRKLGTVRECKVLFSGYSRYKRHPSEWR